MAAPAQKQTRMTKSDLEEVEKVDKSFDDDGPIPPSADERAAYVRKLDLHVMPVIFLIYMLSVLVRS